jgi:hypothetical protein
MVSNKQENGLPDFCTQATNLSKVVPSYFYIWAIVLQRIYDQKQLITVGTKNIEAAGKMRG